MTGTPASISRSALAEGGPHYEALRAEGLRLVQAYAGQVWTDYNAHDPGVTTLEQVCYALTDLGYRAHHPVADLIASGRRAIPRLRPAWRALPAEPATAADFRRLLLDRVPGLGNAWVAPRPADADGLQQGLHDLHLQPSRDPAGEADAAGAGERLRAAAAAVFLGHRPLCEDLHRIVILKPLRVVVAARLVIRRGAEPERVIAEAVDGLSRLLAPEPARRDLPPADGDPSRVFDGPLMRGGLIADADLDRPRPAAIAGAGGAPPGPGTVTAPLVAGLLGDLAEVVEVGGVELWVEGHGPVRPTDVIAVPDDRVCRLDAGLDGEVSPFEVVRDGEARPLPIRGARVRRFVRHAREARRRGRDLMRQYRDRFPAIEGRPRDLDGFPSVAESFPAVYGLGGRGDLPDSPGARPFRGYLAIFDAAMADLLARLAAPRRIFATGRIAPSAARDAAVRAVPHGLRAPRGNAADLPDAADGEEAVLDVLLALAGEDPGAPVLAVAPSGRVAAKERLLRHAGLIARRRGRGFDYREPPSPRRLSAVEIRARVVLSAVAGGAARLRLGLVERNLLRPRTLDRARDERGRHRYPRVVGAVLHVPPGLDAPLARRAVREMLRDEVPAHVGLCVHAVDRDGWSHFERLDRAWRAALRAGDAEEIDWASIELRRALDGFPSEDLR